MEVKLSFKGILNGVHYIWTGKVPIGGIIESIISILYPDKNKKLRKKGEEELLDFVILDDDNTEDDYEEIEIEKSENPEEEPKDVK